MEEIAPGGGVDRQYIEINRYGVYEEVIAKVRNLPFDKLRVNGLRLKSLTFSVRGELVEPQKNTGNWGRFSNISTTMNT